MISVLILTKNEEANIAECLDDLSWCNDIVVLDSFSTDHTVEMAQSRGVRVFQNQFRDFAQQRNFAHERITFKHPWVFHLDADERITPALKAECEAAAAKDQCSGYLIPSKTIFMGKWLRFSGLYPSYQFRLVKPNECSFVQKGHGQREGECTRGVGTLLEPYLHYNFSKGIGEWIEKHNRYSAFEAQELLKDLDAGKFDLGGLFAIGDPVRRRRALKQLSFRLPFRPTLRFWYMYALRLGVLDGAPGLAYCRLLAIYEYMIDLKVRELRRLREGKPV